MRNAIIISLVVLILLLGAAWIYLLLNGSPESMDEVRTTLFGTSSDRPLPSENAGENQVPEEEPAESNVVPVGSILAKLSARKVAGATFGDDSGEPVVRYMEKGTGNIYEIALASGAETRISNTTVPGVVEAIWAKSGGRVVMITDIEGVRGKTLLGTLLKSDAGETSFETEDISAPADVENLAWDAVGDTVYYAKRSSVGGTLALRHHLKSNTTEEIFTVPFGNAEILWDTQDGSTHYVYTKPAAGHLGYLYKVVGGDLIKVDEGENLTASRISPTMLSINKITGGAPYSLLSNIGTGLGTFISGQMPREKCAGGEVMIWCGGDPEKAPTSYPILWYQGLVSYTDRIWSINPEDGATTMVADPETIAREALDITDMMLGESGHIIFRNKKDDSLWLFNPQ